MFFAPGPGGSGGPREVHPPEPSVGVPGPPGATRRPPGPNTHQNKRPRNLKVLIERWRSVHGPTDLKLSGPWAQTIWTDCLLIHAMFRAQTSPKQTRKPAPGTGSSTKQPGLHPHGPCSQRPRPSFLAVKRCRAVSNVSATTGQRADLQ